MSLQSYPHSISLPSIPSHWERMDGHGIPTLYVPTVHPVPLGTDGRTWDTHTLCPYRPSRPTGNGWTDMGYPHSMSLPSIFSHWERMDGHEMSLQSYPHSVSLPSIPSHCTTGNGWTDMGCPFNLTTHFISVVNAILLQWVDIGLILVYNLYLSRQHYTVHTSIPEYHCLR